MKRIFTIFLAFAICNSANASRCGLSVTFVNAGPMKISIQASIEWQDMEIDPEEEEPFPGYVPHSIKVDAESKVTELFAFPCGYPGDPQEFWVNYRVTGVEAFKKLKYEKGIEIMVGNGA